MDTCKYHPLSPATFRCNHCFTLNCDRCIDEGSGREEESCFHCSQPVEHLGAVNEAAPFWRRLEESFKYPLNLSTIIFIVFMSFAITVVGFIPFAFIGYLILTGIFLQYCFKCLESTAQGLLVPPEISDSYGGGIALIAKLLVIVFAMGAVIYSVDRFLGPQFAGLFVFLLAVALPAVFIIFGMTNNLLEALNPLSIIQLITSIGLPYGLILGFILVMSASVGVINELIGYEFTVVSSSLQSIVSNYYMIVMFHIMGYTIFQYQGELGFTAREDFGDGKAYRSDRDRLAAKLDVTLKEGRYNDVVKLFDTALKQYPNDKEFNKQYFEFLYASKRTQVIEESATRYLSFLVRSKQDHQLTIVYKRVLQQMPTFKPDTANLRCILANACKKNGDSISAVKLINGLHKEFPEFKGLVEAYELMADALDDIPHKQEQAKKCRLLVEQLKKKNPPSENKESAKPTFELAAGAKDPNETSESSESGAGVKPTEAFTKKSTFELEPEKNEDTSTDTASTSKDLPPIEFKL